MPTSRRDTVAERTKPPPPIGGLVLVSDIPNSSSGEPSRAPFGASARVAVIIPARDEEDSLPALLSVLRSLPSDPSSAVFGPIVVVDNGSQDQTARVAAAGGATVLFEHTPGYGISCLKAMAWLALEDPRPDVLLFVDADQSCLSGLFERVVHPVVSGAADLSLGRRVEGSVDGETLALHQRYGNRFILAWVWAAFGWRFSDLPPLRAISFSALDKLEMDDQDWGWTLQMQLRARSHGLRIAECEVPHRERAEGESKISGSLRTSIRVGWTMLRTIARERIRHARRGRQDHRPESTSES